MRRHIMSELLKNRRGFANTMIIAVPIICVACAVFIMNGNYVQIVAYNWWYLIFLPFVIAFWSAQIIRHDMKLNFHGLLGIVTDKARLAYGKVIVSTICMTASNCFFFAIVVGVGILFGTQIRVFDGLWAVIVLSIVFAWQIPFFMLMSIKWNVYVSVILSVICNFGIACMAAMEAVWWIPFSIPARMMYHILGVLPNGIFEETSVKQPYAGIVWGGIVITLYLYLLMMYVFAKVFEKQEV